MSQSHTTDQPTALRGRGKEQKQKLEALLQSKLYIQSKMLTTRTRLKVLTELAGETSGVTASPVSHVECLEAVNDDGEREVKRERRRKNIIEELFETEKTYLNHLEVTQKFFEFPLRFNCLIPEKDHAKLFSNLEQILEVNKKLLEHMEQTTVGTAFKFLGPFLKLYSLYAKNHGEASTTLQDYLSKNVEFGKFVQEQEDRPEVMGLKLGALLITPVQRVPRYKLLLEDLLENTVQEHHDYQQLKDAAKQVGEIACYINEHVRQHENFQKMLSIQNSFDNSAPNILEPGREFVREGPLKKKNTQQDWVTLMKANNGRFLGNSISRRGGKPQDRMFFLFSDIILYGKSRLLDTGNNSYSCCCVLPLRHCQVETVLGSVQRSDGGGMFRITCKDESFLLSSVDMDEAKAWMECIEASIRKLNLNRQTLRKPSSNKVPMRGKSLVKLRVKEKKTDLRKKVLNKGKRGSGSSKDNNSDSTASPSVLSEISIGNCLTPPSKRPRTHSELDAVSEDERLDSTYKAYEQSNEVSLDAWSPSGASSSLYYDENSAMNSPNNSFMQVTLDDFNNLSGSQKLDDDDLDFCSGSNSNRSSVISNTYSVASGDSRTTVNSGRLEGTSYSGVGEFSSQPWTNPKFAEEEKHSCATWPIRKVLQSGSKVTSGIGGVMDSVRSRKRCSVM